MSLAGVPVSSASGGTLEPGQSPGAPPSNGIRGASQLSAFTPVPRPSNASSVPPAGSHAPPSTTSSLINVSTPLTTWPNAASTCALAEGGMEAVSAPSAPLPSMSLRSSRAVAMKAVPINASTTSTAMTRMSTDPRRPEKSGRPTAAVVIRFCCMVFQTSRPADPRPTETSGVYGFRR